MLSRNMVDVMEFAAIFSFGQFWAGHLKAGPFMLGHLDLLDLFGLAGFINQKIFAKIGQLGLDLPNIFWIYKSNLSGHRNTAMYGSSQS